MEADAQRHILAAWTTKELANVGEKLFGIPHTLSYETAVKIIQASKMPHINQGDIDFVFAQKRSYMITPDVYGIPVIRKDDMQDRDMNPIRTLLSGIAQQERESPQADVTRRQIYAALHTEDGGPYGTAQFGGVLYWEIPWKTLWMVKLFISIIHDTTEAVDELNSRKAQPVFSRILAGDGSQKAICDAMNTSMKSYWGHDMGGDAFGHALERYFESDKGQHALAESHVRFYNSDAGKAALEDSLFNAMVRMKKKSNGQ